MARQNINRGTIANDGTGDTLRTAAKKINDNFVELYLTIGGDSDIVTSKVSFVDSGLSFEGTTVNTNDTILTVEDPTDLRKVTIPDATGILIMDSASQTMTNKTLTSPVLTTPQINDTSANHQYVVAPSELAADRTITLPLLTGDDEVTFNAHTQTLGNKTLTTPILTTPIVGGKNLGGFIDDSAGNELIEFDRVASAVNHIKISNVATTNNPKIEAVGDDTNVSLNLASKGTGAVNINTRLAMNVNSVATTTAVDLAKPLTIFTASSGTISPTLGSGQEMGEIHNFIAKGAAVVKLQTDNNINSVADSADAYFRFEQKGTLSLQWDGDKWNVLSSKDSADGTGQVLLTKD